MRILSDIPTERAMKELGRTTMPLQATRKAVETIALWKDPLVKSLRLMRIREQALEIGNRAKYEQMSRVDQVMADYIRDNHNFKFDD